MRKLIKKILIILTGNSFSQKSLKFIMRVCQFLMGIGSGAEVSSSGEIIAIKKLKKILTPPFVIFDVGANIGLYTGVLVEELRMVEYDIHCFEPSHDTFQTLQETFLTNNRVHLNNIAINNKSGEAFLWYEEPHSVRASLTRRNLEHKEVHFNGSEKVQVKTIDQYCAENSIEHIHLIKLDIEGHEYQALESAEKLFSKEGIDMVSFEFGGGDIDTRRFFKDFFSFFRNHGMRIFRISPSGFLVHIEEYDEYHEQFLTTNFLAVHNKHIKMLQATI